MKSWSREKAQHLLQGYLHDRVAFSSRQLTIPDALRVDEFYHHVTFFATSFASSTLSKLPVVDGHGNPQAPLSPNEWRRIEGNLYRFELYCNLFRNHRPKFRQTGLMAADEEQRDLFFKMYSPWENEQLACIHDFLWRQLSIRTYCRNELQVLNRISKTKYISVLAAFNDVAEHDLLWGEMSIPCDEDETGIHRMESGSIISSVVTTLPCSSLYKSMFIGQGI